MATETTTHISELVPDPANLRTHNARNIGMLVDSLHEVGAARSIVVDENNKILAGNGLVEAAGEAGIEKVKVVEADGETIIAVRRTGLTEEQKTRLALFDNRTSELSTFDPEALNALLNDGFDMGTFFTNRELEDLFVNVPIELNLPEESSVPTLSVVQEPGSATNTTNGLKQEYSEPTDISELPTSQVRMVQLFLDTTTHPQFMQWCVTLQQHFATDNITDTVFKAVELAATSSI